MAAYLDKAAAFVERLVEKAKGGDKAVIAAGAAAAVVGLVVVGSLLLAPGDGEKYMTPEQKALQLAPITVTTGAGKTATVARVDRKAIRDAAGVLAAANKANPLYVAAGKESFDEAARERALHWLFSVLLRATVPSSSGAITLRTTDASAATNAVAIWFPRGKTVDSSTLFKAGGWQFVWKYSGWERRGRIFGYGTAIQAVRSSPGHCGGHEGAYFYLLAYGVNAAAPAEDRQAALDAVVLPVTKQADALSQPCYVEVTLSRDIPLFEALGFTVVGGAASGDDDAAASASFKLFDVGITCLKRAPKALPSTSA